MSHIVEAAGIPSFCIVGAGASLTERPDYECVFCWSDVARNIPAMFLQEGVGLEMVGNAWLKLLIQQCDFEELLTKRFDNTACEDIRYMQCSQDSVERS